jgi:hypothetical protein
MGTYVTDIPQLDVLASGIDDNAAAAIQIGDNLDEAHVSAATLQHKNRKRLATTNPPMALPEEVVQSKRRKHQVESANFDGPTPLWAQQMQQQMTQLQQQLERRIDRESQRSMNRSRRNNREEIQPVIRLNDGQTPTDHNIHFPENQVALEDLTGPHVVALLNFYGLDVNGNIRAKKDRLMRHLGVTL